ncbi:alpha/beta hydrolase [Bradyrhizobium sp. BR 10289]|uniref:alpha/beta fold hydrolase n=1 Tax=Bradyrhizobium sp. BR 10289 TaxID=2749993 RepID=UPI001C64FD96|nr:alpha/beta hydrolase [Bradyrhizobium sp. BR 10289]MBW7970554.1 alpha/beta fold hydrolase [Bradyrhizobium sp. BR 10289]
MERIEANGISIRFKRSGEGPPLVLLHGAEADHAMFDAFAAHLAPHFTVIAYDQRDSGGTRNPAAPYGLGELADDLAALIAGLGLSRAHVLGTSFGGAIAQVAAVRHPARIDRLVLASTFRVGVSVASINPEGFPRFAELRAKLPESLSAFAEYFFPPSYIATNPQALGIFTGNKRDAGQRERRGAVLAQPIAISLAGIRAPTLVLAGRDDRLIPPAHTLSLAREIAGAHTAVIDGVGHVGTIQDPAAVAAQVIAFLDGKKTEHIAEENDHGGIRGGSGHSL